MHLTQREHEVGGRGNAKRADGVTVSRRGQVMRKPLGGLVVKACFGHRATDDLVQETGFL